MYFIVPLPFIILGAIGIRGAMLPGALNGWVYLFTPDFSKFWTLKLWRDALNQIIFSESLGTGAVIF